MENHTLDINKRYKNVSKTWDNESNQKLVGHKSVDGDPFSNVFQSRLIDEVEPYLKELGERIELNTDENLYDDNIVIKNVSSKVNGKFDCDRDPFSDFCQKIVQDEVDKFLDKRKQDVSDKTVDVYGKIGLTGDNGTVYAQSAISSFDSSNSIEMVDHPTNLDKVFDKMEDEKHSLETNDVYDWTKPTPSKIVNGNKRAFKVDINNISPDDYNPDKYPVENLLMDVYTPKPHPLTIGDENVGKEKSTKDYITNLIEDLYQPIEPNRRRHSEEPSKLDTIEKAPQYNSEVFPEVIVMMEDNFKIIATMCFAKLNSFKYRMRTGLKDVKKIEEDIKKAMNYESRYKVFLEKMKSIFYKDKVLPLIIGDETFEMKVIGNDYKTEIQNIKLYLEKYATETK